MDEQQACLEIFLPPKMKILLKVRQKGHTSGNTKTHSHNTVYV